MTNPVIGFARTCAMLIRKDIVFDADAVGKKMEMDDGVAFTVFRHVAVKGREEPGALFMVRFKPKNMTIEENIRFSIIPMMVFMGFGGFRGKYWGVDQESGLCQGLYEWQTVVDAERYSRSIAMRFMANRSEEGSVMFRVIDMAKCEFPHAIR